MSYEAGTDTMHPCGDGARTIAVLLSTYNGTIYLPEQLASIENQTYPHWRLVWRDDGSSDQTRALMGEFAARVGEARCQELKEPSGRLGVIASYLRLLRVAQEYPFVAFADQDDVWLPGKLARAVRFLQLTTDRPALYCGRQILVDHDLRLLGRSPSFRADIPFPSALAQNIATGCTILLNRQAACVIAKSQPPSDSVHDWWCYIVVSALGGPIFFDEAPHILYRQHGGNAIGWASVGTRIHRALHRRPSDVLQIVDTHAQAVQDSVPALPSDTNHKLEHIRRALRMPLATRLGLALRKDLRRQHWLGDLLMASWIATGRIPQ